MILTDNSGRQYDLFDYQISGVDLLTFSTGTAA